MRLIFMGTPDFSVPILEALAAAHEVIAVYAQPPSVSGRGQKQRISPVHARADELGIPVFTPKSLKSEKAQTEFASHKADAAVVAAYGLILPQAILDVPRLGCLNVHASLLPRWRGAAPIQRAIMAGDTESGVTIMQMEAGLDTGPVLLRESVAITDATTAGSLHDALSELGAQLIGPALKGCENNTLKAQLQPDVGVTYAPKIDKAEAAIAFDKAAEDVVRHIHGLSPFPGGFVEINGQRIKILLAEAVPIPDSQSAESGTLLTEDFLIACASGGIRPLRVQRAGKGPVETEAFLRGFKLPLGTRVG